MTALARLSLNALRTFEAAARLGSFLAAADELSVTPGAVSRQIKALEADLGIRLFDRFNRAVRLTEVGERLALGLADGFARVEEAVGRATPTPDNRLVISVLHSLASKWLVPRLPRFEALYPDVDVLVSAADRPVDLAREGVDVALRMGPGPYPGLDALLLMPSWVFPVCSPAMAQGLKRPADLAHVPLIHDLARRPDEPTWEKWMAMAGVSGVDTERGQRFSNSYLAVDAAVAGRGVALAEDPIAIDDLAAGRLVRPFPQRMRSPFSTWALTLPERADQLKIRRFRGWLVEQARADGLDHLE
jgi:LysR family glycine cleavage system transcriptional activator